MASSVFQATTLNRSKVEKKCLTVDVLIKGKHTKEIWAGKLFQKPTIKKNTKRKITHKLEEISKQICMYKQNRNENNTNKDPENNFREFVM